ncbi:MAG: hypothetical protein Q8R79_06550 [Legionellaceae bacterium]|nr:hypothetical protein [Legionellaceae bacterium]
MPAKKKPDSASHRPPMAPANPIPAPRAQSASRVPLLRIPSRVPLLRIPSRVTFDIPATVSESGSSDEKTPPSSSHTIIQQLRARPVRPLSLSIFDENELPLYTRRLEVIQRLYKRLQVIAEQHKDLDYYFANLPQTPRYCSNLHPQNFVKELEAFLRPKKGLVYTANEYIISPIWQRITWLLSQVFVDAQELFDLFSPYPDVLFEFLNNLLSIVRLIVGAHITLTDLFKFSPADRSLIYRNSADILQKMCKRIDPVQQIASFCDITQQSTLQLQHQRLPSQLETATENDHRTTHQPSAMR